MWDRIEELSSNLGQALLAQQAWLATAESCTGGLLAGAVTSIAGSSQWFDRGWITYSNRAKRDELGVGADILKEYGAVSADVAEAMATGVLRQVSQATIALTTTGIAGPGGATPGKPVGLVWFGFGSRHKDGTVDSRSESVVFPGDRQAIRLAAVAYALESAIRMLDDRR